MRLSKTVVIVHGHLFTHFDRPDADEGAILFHLDVGFLGVIEENRHVHGVHAHDGYFNRLFVIVAKQFDLFLHAFGQLFDLFVAELNFFVLEPTL